MYVVQLYQLPKSDRWRWKLVAPNGRIIARADYHYNSRSEAKRSFAAIKKALSVREKIPCAVWKGTKLEPYGDI